jgi:hypothetical protein
VRVPGFHRRSLIRVAEVREDGVAAVDVGEIAFDQLALAPLGAAAEVAPHRVERLETPLLEEPRRPAAILVRVGRPGEVDAPHVSQLQAPRVRP